MANLLRAPKTIVVRPLIGVQRVKCWLRLHFGSKVRYSATGQRVCPICGKGW